MAQSPGLYTPVTVPGGGTAYVPVPKAPTGRARGGRSNTMGTLIVLGVLGYVGWSLTHPGETIGVGVQPSALRAALAAPTQPAAKTAVGQAAMAAHGTMGG